MLEGLESITLTFIDKHVKTFVGRHTTGHRPWVFGLHQDLIWKWHPLLLSWRAFPFMIVYRMTGNPDFQYISANS